MAITFDAPFPDPSASVGFGYNPLIRDAEYRDEESLPTALADPKARFLVFAGANVLLRKDESPTPLFGAGEIEPYGVSIERAVLLGQTDDGPWIAVPGKIDAEALPEPFKLYDFRSLLYSSSVNEAQAGAVAQGGALLHWHRTNRFCGKCGTPSEMKIGGYKRDCPQCGHAIFPRTDPVVIMLAVDGDRCLMGRSPHFPPGWYSTLAGFVEPGETIEDAVRRETLEESGIEVRRVRYFASQPWPFPHSLMIGVHCEAVSSAITRDEAELEDCRWFSRKDVQLMVRDEHPEGYKCPPTRAIAHTLIRAWMA